MRFVKLIFIVMFPLSLSLAENQCLGEDNLPYPNGFHNGGTGSCNGCHSKLTNSAFNNNSTVRESATGTETKQYMLNGVDASSTCLICHAAPANQKLPSGIYVATRKEDLVAGGLPPTQLTPGGDFGWLLKTYRWSSRGNGINDEISPGELHGHNVVAQDFGLVADYNYQQAPGGTYPADQLSCTSCHDPHGYYRRTANGKISVNGPPIKASGSYSTSPDPDENNAVGTYRLLAGQGYQPKSLIGDYAFKADPPVAASPANYNRSENSSDTRVAYGSGMTEWCRNCHFTTHQDAHPMGNSTNIGRSSGKMTPNVIAIYNRYVSSGKRAGSKDHSYNSLVPFEMGTTDYSIVKATANSDGTNGSGPNNGSNVMCLTCHRAHASGWDYSLRWNNRAGMITIDNKYIGTDTKAPPNAAQGRLSVETSKAFYDRSPESFGRGQRNLCNKCHEKD